MNKTTCNYCSVDFGKEFDRHWKKKCPRRIDEGYISKIESYDDPSDPKSVRNTIVWVMKRMRSSKFIHSNDLEIAIPFLKETSNVLIGIPEYKLVAQDMNRRFHEMEEWARGRKKSGLDWMKKRLKEEEKERLK